MSKIETTSKVSLKLMSRINLGRRGARAKLSTLDTAHKPSPTARKGPPPGQKGPIVPTETTNNSHRPEKRTQMAITDYAQNRNHKQSATEAHQQDKPRKAKCTRKPIPRPWTQTAPWKGPKANHKDRRAIPIYTALVALSPIIRSSCPQIFSK